MMTTAIPEGEADPTIFVLDVRDRPWDGSAGLELIAEWDGMGMAATQSHAMRLEGAPRCGWPGTGRSTRHPRRRPVRRHAVHRRGPRRARRGGRASPASSCATEADKLRAYEQVEWARAEQDHWLAVQAYEGALRAIESGDPTGAFHGALRAKEAVADLAEQIAARASPGSSAAGRSRSARRSPTGSRTCAPWVPAAAVGPRLRRPPRDVVRDRQPAKREREADPQQAAERLLDGGVERADHPVELGLGERGDGQLAAEEHGVLDADREVGADEPLVAAQQVLVQLRRRSPPAPASRTSRSAACAGRASATPS